MRPSTALSKARRLVSMHRLGGQWVVASWDASAQAWRESSPRDWWAARQARSDAVKVHAGRLLGFGEDVSVNAAYSTRTQAEWIAWALRRLERAP